MFKTAWKQKKRKYAAWSEANSRFILTSDIPARLLPGNGMSDYLWRSKSKGGQMQPLRWENNLLNQGWKGEHWEEIHTSGPQMTLEWCYAEGKVSRLRHYKWTYLWPGQRSSCPQGSVAPDRSVSLTLPGVDWSENKVRVLENVNRSLLTLISDKYRPTHPHRAVRNSQAAKLHSALSLLPHFSDSVGQWIKSGVKEKHLREFLSGSGLSDDGVNVWVMVISTVNDPERASVTSSTSNSPHRACVTL